MSVHIECVCVCGGGGGGGELKWYLHNVTDLPRLMLFI